LLFRPIRLRPWLPAVAVLLALSLGAFGQSAPPIAYYDPAIAQTGNTLKGALHEIIKGHTVLPYTATTTDTWDALMRLDEAPWDSASVVLVYSGLTNLKTNNYTAGVGAGKWSREHLVPQSYGLVAISSSSRAKTDVFNLRPADYTVNSTRSNLYYDTTTTPFRTTASAPGSSYDSDSWEPGDEDKGMVARAAFYMATRYDGTDPDVPDLELSATPDAATYRFGKLSKMLAWNRQYPPTAAERLRNQRIYDTLQHNRNPFIDHPEYADMVFNGASPAQAWKSLRFTAQELLTPAISDDTADADGDGLPNLVEYALRSDPRQPNPAPIAASAATVGDVRYIYLTFPRNRNATDTAISYESSGDCATWTPVAAEPISAVVADFETEQWTVRVPAAAPRFFVRVRVNKP